MTDKQIKNIQLLKRQGVTNKEIVCLIGVTTEGAKKHLQRHPPEEPSIRRFEPYRKVIIYFDNKRAKRFCSSKCRMIIETNIAK